MKQPKTLPIKSAAPIGIGFGDGLASPRRIQLSRKGGWKMPPNTVVVSRPSKWGNPYKLGGFVPCIGTLKNMTDVVEAYRQYVVERLAEENPRGAVLRLDMDINLKGKNLACWCPLDQPCHADVLLRLANADIRNGDRADAAFK